MTPTPKLRFVKRDQYTSMPQYGTNAVYKDIIQVLQQWHAYDINYPTEKGEWRDVPVEKEA